MSLPVVAVVVMGALAVLAAERRIGWLQVVAKPLTTALLFWVVGWPSTRVAGWVHVGIALSVLGDAALLGRGKAAFLAGLGAFLLAHVAYAVSFVGVAVWSPRVVVAAVVMLAVTGRMLRAIRGGTAGMRGPTVAYGLGISAMVVAAFATLGGPLPGAWMAAAGALFFYASDASLALDKFRRPIPHAPFLTLGLYWIGQLGIALAARGGR